MSTKHIETSGALEPSADDDRPLIFFVDDELHILNSLRRALLDDPWRIETFTRPDDALSRILPDAPAVVVSDYYMPGTLGCDFLTRVRDMDRAITRIILTAKPDLSTVVCSVEPDTIHRYLIKPWKHDRLCTVLSAGIEQFHKARKKFADPREELEDSR